MTFTTGWTAEAQKQWGGEALAGRMYVSPIGTYDISITNFWNPEKVFVSHSSPDGGYSATTDYGYPIPQLEGDVYNLWDTLPTAGSLQLIRSDHGYLKLADTICMSMYIHSATTEEYSGCSLAISPVISGVGGSEDYISAVFSGEAGSESAMTIWFTAGTAFHSAGNEYIGSGWSRIWVTATQPDTERDLRTYYAYLYKDLGTTGLYNRKDLYFAGPMLDGGTTTPRDYRFRQGVEVHPSTPIQISDYDTTISTNPITRKRERYYGVVQGQSFPINVVNTDIEDMSNFLPDAKYAIQFGFPSYEEWHTVSQGTIGSIQRNADMSLTLNVEDSIMRLLNTTLKRDYTFGLEPWTSEVKSRVLADGSDDYDNDTGEFSAITEYSAYTIDQEFTVVFDNATQFKIYNEQGTIMREWVSDGTVFSTSADANFYPSEMRTFAEVYANVYTLTSDGWGSTNVAGDTFVFTSSKPRTLEQLSPVGMAKHLIKDVADLYVFDLDGSDYFDTPLYNEEEWDEYIGQTSGSTNTVTGYWKKGKKYMNLIQDCLKLEHCSIFPTDDGRIGFSSILDLASGTTVLNGNPDDTVSIFDGSYVQETMDEFANYVTVEYLNIDSGETTTYSVASEDKTREDRDKVIKVGWRVSEETALVCAVRALTRFNAPKKVFTIASSLAFAATELNQAVTIQDDFLGANYEKVVITEKALDLNGQKVNLVAWNDPLSLLDIARIDVSSVGGTEVIW